MKSFQIVLWCIMGILALLALLFWRAVLPFPYDFLPVLIGPFIGYLWAKRLIYLQDASIS